MPARDIHADTLSLCAHRGFGRLATQSHQAIVEFAVFALALRRQQSARGNNRSRAQHGQILHHHADIAVLAQQFSHLAGQPFAEGAARIEKLHNRDIAARIAAHRVGRVAQKRCLMRADARGER